MNTKAVRFSALAFLLFIALMVTLNHQGPQRYDTTVFQYPVTTNFLPSIIGAVIGALLLLLHYGIAYRFTKKATGPWISLSAFALLFIWLQNASFDYTRTTSQHEITNDLIRRCSDVNLYKDLTIDCMTWIKGGLIKDAYTGKAIPFANLPEQTRTEIISNLEKKVSN